MIAADDERCIGTLPSTIGLSPPHSVRLVIKNIPLGLLAHNTTAHYNTTPD